MTQIKLNTSTKIFEVVKSFKEQEELNPDTLDLDGIIFVIGSYNYGYDIKPEGPNGQFHHENKAEDGVVYGCYGYLDPNDKAQITYYVSGE